MPIMISTMAIKTRRYVIIRTLKLVVELHTGQTPMDNC